MKGRFYIAAATLVFTAYGCTRSEDTCDDLTGVITHSTTELTGIESASAYKKNSETGALEAVDQINGSEFSNLSIEVNLSWIEEQHRFRAPNTFTQSFLDWLVSPAIACSLIPYHEDYHPSVTRIEIFSDSDFNEEWVAGSNLAAGFAASGAMGVHSSLLEASEFGGLMSARSYSLEPAWTDVELGITPATPATHVFTIMITLDDGRVHEIRTPEVLLSGV